VRILPLRPEIVGVFRLLLGTGQADHRFGHRNKSAFLADGGGCPSQVVRMMVAIGILKDLRRQRVRRRHKDYGPKGLLLALSRPIWSLCVSVRIRDLEQRSGITRSAFFPKRSGDYSTSTPESLGTSQNYQREDQRAFGLFGDMSVAGGIGRLPASGVSPFWQLRIEPSHCTFAPRQTVRLT